VRSLLWHTIAGLVASLARPRENVTGFTILGPELEAKRLELLKQAVPNAARVAILRNPNNPAVVSYFEATKTAGRTLKIALDPVAEVRRADEFDNAFLAIASARPHAIAVLADRFLLAHRKRIIEFAAANRLPAMYPYREYVDAGGLISYAPSNIELFRGAATYVDKILKGAKPSDLPVQEPTKFELIVNLKTAKALGLEVPPTLRRRYSPALTMWLNDVKREGGSKWNFPADEFCITANALGLEIPPTLLARADEVIEWSGASSSRCLVAQPNSQRPPGSLAERPLGWTAGVFRFHSSPVRITN
jgi:hypothetical protein